MRAVSALLAASMVLPAAARAESSDEQIVLSGALCYYQGRRIWALQEIAKERKYSKIGGAINLRHIWNAQQAIRVADEKTADVRSRMRQAGVRPLSCKGEVYHLANCVYQRAIGIDEADICSEDLMSELIKSVNALDQEGREVGP